ncbi:MAG TPA: hypothetical protein VJB91_01600 [Patescibacteria group bacterium]|nr:hypothetical protein [Patescibacteria group bacterium]
MGENPRAAGLLGFLMPHYGILFSEKRMIVVPIGLIISLIVFVIVLAVVLAGTVYLLFSIPLILTAFFSLLLLQIIYVFLRKRKMQTIKNPASLLHINFSFDHIDWSLDNAKAKPFIHVSVWYRLFSFFFSFLAAFFVLTIWQPPYWNVSKIDMYATLIITCIGVIIVQQANRPQKGLEKKLDIVLQPTYESLRDISTLHSEATQSYEQTLKEVEDIKVRPLIREVEKLHERILDPHIINILQEQRYDAAKEKIRHINDELVHLKDYAISYQERQNKGVLEDFQSFKKTRNNVH